MKTWVLSIAAGCLVAGASPGAAFAQAKAADKTPAKAPAAAPATPAAPTAESVLNTATQGVKAKPRVIDFEDETIRGTLTKPEGDFIDARKRAKQKSLIKIRPHFVPELLKSADDL